MMSLLRKRQYFTEPEARVYMTQLISAIQYMHSARVMHRDLKLGNVFVLDRAEKGLCCQIGDFGLAALLDKDSDRRK
jgi:cell cycle serine/threonine-protein kinase CDC5/MSD2